MRKACGVNSRAQMAFAFDIRCELVLFIHSHLYKLHIYRINLFWFFWTHNVNANKFSVKTIRIEKCMKLCIRVPYVKFKKKKNKIYLSKSLDKLRLFFTVRIKPQKCQTSNKVHIKYALLGLIHIQMKRSKTA